MKGPRAAALFVTAVSASAEGHDKLLNIPDLGRRLQIGALYDARTDQPVGGYLWPPQLLKSHIHETPAHYSGYSFAFEDNFQAKSELLDVQGDMKLSANAGMVKVQGSAKYLFDHQSSSQSIRMSTAFRFRTRKQTLDIFNPELPLDSYGVSQVLQNQLATHVVTSVTWGADCVALFEHSFRSRAEKEKLETYMKLVVKTGAFSLEAEASYGSNEEMQSYATSTSVRLFGDVVPSQTDVLPTTAPEALQFMKELHRHGNANESQGVPMELTLMPISWIDSAAARLQREIAAQMIDEAGKIFDSFDESVAVINDLLVINPDGFLKWHWSTNDWKNDILKYRAGYVARLRQAIVAHRNGTSGDDTLNSLIGEYYASGFQLDAVRERAQKEEDTIMNLKALVKELGGSSAVTTAESFSDFQAPTFDSTFDRVYGLVIVGMNPANDRSSIAAVREFVHFAKSKVGSDIPGADHCVEAVRDGASMCVEYLKFVSIHFDTFCEQFCDPEFCSSDYARCDGVNSSQRAPYSDRQIWCACPSTSVLLYAKSQAAEDVTDKIPKAPSKPVVLSHHGDQEVEDSPYHQTVTLHLDSSHNLGAVDSFRVRAVWRERSMQSNVLTWTRHEKSFDTFTSSKTILVRDLVAGQRYSFMVSGLNHVGEGPPSDEYPSAGPIVVAHNMVGMSAVQASPSHSSRPTGNYSKASLNQVGVDGLVLPSWKSWRAMLNVSIKAYEQLAKATLNVAGTVHPCTNVKDASTMGLNCSFLKTDYDEDVQGVIEVYTASGERIAWSSVTVQAPGEFSCNAFETLKVFYCEFKKKCVTSCDDCYLIEDEPTFAVDTEDGSKKCVSSRCHGSDSMFCPADLVNQDDPCVPKDEAAQEKGCNECYPGAKYYNGNCALPCEISFRTVNNQGDEVKDESISGAACAILSPGGSCNFTCAEPMYMATGLSQDTFICPIDNSIIHHQPSTVALGCKSLQTVPSPIGVISMWSGSIADIPEYWVLCNGSDGTPDLRDKFVVGCGGGSSRTCGAASSESVKQATSSRDGGHVHTGNVHGHQLTVAEMPSHDHIQPEHHRLVDCGDGCWAIASWQGANLRATWETGGNQEHSHNMTIGTGGEHHHTVEMDVTPPYYALCFIMYKGP